MEAHESPDVAGMPDAAADMSDAAADAVDGAANTSDAGGTSDAACQANLSNDAMNCGRCGFTCPGTCANYACVLAQPGTATYTFNDFSCIATDGTNVYFTASNVNGTMGSDVLYVPSGGGAVQVLGGTNGTRAAGVTTFGDFVYWADYSLGWILEAPKPGVTGSTRVVVKGLTQPIRVAVDATAVYWTSTIGAGAAEKSTGTVLWTTNQTGGQAWGLTIDSASLYYADPALGEVVRVNLTTGAAAVAVPNQPGVRGLFGDTSNLYWTTTSSGDVMMSAKSPINPITIVQGQASPREIAVDQTVAPSEVYWVDVSTTGDVSKAAATGGATAGVVAPNQQLGECLAVDATSVYWNVVGGQILKAPK
jgi:hypothetical protein